MTIVKDIKYNRRLYQIMAYIAQDKKSVAIKFEKALKSGAFKSTMQSYNRLNYLEWSANLHMTSSTVIFR